MFCSTVNGRLLVTIISTISWSIFLMDGHHFSVPSLCQVVQLQSFGLFHHMSMFWEKISVQTSFCTSFHVYFEDGSKCLNFLLFFPFVEP